MKKIAAFALFTLIVFMGCRQQQAEPEKIVLFDGSDLSQWTLFIPGDSVDVNDVWSIKDGAVHCVGVPNGYMRTNETFSNYKLQLEWRWVENPTNSGVLLHCSGENQVWPNCIEAQLKAGSAGDFVLIGPGQITVDDSTYINEQRFLTVPKKHESNEKLVGEWNTYEIETKDGEVTLWVNGVQQNHGTDCSHTSGFIALQSEGSPIEFRNIQLTPLD